MKLRYYIQEGKKIYTLKESINGKETKPAHYKFIRNKSESETPRSELLPAGKSVC